jgi:putative toxin-antitoxin system antitoxin component (TIGR02293 family)
MAEGSMATTLQVVNALGGFQVLGQRPRTLDALRATIRVGLPYPTLEALIGNFALDRGAVLGVLGIPERTLARRKKQARLEAIESDRLTRVARIAAIAEETLGARDKAGRWLQKPNRALGGAVPLRILDTDLGAEQVETILGRIAHGIVG